MAKWRVFRFRAASSLIWGDGLFFFDGGGGRGKVENFHMQIFFLNGCGSCCKRFFCGCLRQFLQTLFFSCIVSVFTASANNLFQTPPTPVKKTMVRPLERCIPLNLCNSTVFQI